MRNYHTNKVIKRIMRTVTVLAMAAVMTVNVMPVPADAKTKTVNAARKANVDNPISNKSLAELKSTPSVKVGKTTVKVGKMTSKTKKNTFSLVNLRNGTIGNADYNYFSFVKFTAPKTGIYYFTFSNLNVNGNKDKMYSLYARLNKEVKNKDQNALGRVWYDNLNLDGERIDYTGDYKFEYGYEPYETGEIRELLTANYKDVAKNYIDTTWTDYYLKNNPDADAEELVEAKEDKQFDLDVTLKGIYDVWLPADSSKDSSKYYNPTTGTYHTHEKLKKGQTVLIALSNPCEFTWKPYDGDKWYIGTDARRTISKSSYTIDLTIKKKK